MGYSDFRRNVDSGPRPLHRPPSARIRFSAVLLLLHVGLRRTSARTPRLHSGLLPVVAARSDHHVFDANISARQHEIARTWRDIAIDTWQLDAPFSAFRDGVCLDDRLDLRLAVQERITRKRPDTSIFRQSTRASHGTLLGALGKYADTARPRWKE